MDNTAGLAWVLICLLLILASWGVKGWAFSQPGEWLVTLQDGTRLQGSVATCRTDLIVHSENAVSRVNLGRVRSLEQTQGEVTP